MLKIGYIRLPDLDADPSSAVAAMTALGCDVVRAETPAQPDGESFAMLDSILAFIGDGDQLVVQRLEQVGDSGRGMLEVLQRLEQRGASLHVVDPGVTSRGPGGPALRAALEAVAALEPSGDGAPRRAGVQDMRALKRAGVGPVEIARRLGVSRMTVWRKLKALETCDA